MMKTRAVIGHALTAQKSRPLSWVMSVRLPSHEASFNLTGPYCPGTNRESLMPASPAGSVNVRQDRMTNPGNVSAHDLGGTKTRFDRAGLRVRGSDVPFIASHG
jgi:hypothetical protein